MVVEALKVPHVFIQICFGLLADFLLFGYFGVRLSLLSFVLVASIVAACGGSMLFPISQAEPAEFVSTPGRRPTSHVVAALVLLDVPVALRTGFRVRHYPSNIFALRRVLQVSLLKNFAVGGSVRLFPT